MRHHYADEAPLRGRSSAYLRPADEAHEERSQRLFAGGFLQEAVTHSLHVVIEAVELLLREAVRRPHRLYRRTAAESFVEGGVERRLRDGVETLKLARRGAVVLLRRVVEKAEGKDKDEEVGRASGNDEVDADEQAKR